VVRQTEHQESEFPVTRTPPLVGAIRENKLLKYEDRVTVCNGNPRRQVLNGT